MDLQHEERLTKVEARSKSNQNRLDKMEKRQDSLEDLCGSIKVLANRQETVETDVKEIKTDVKELASKPGKRWEGIVDKAIWAVLAAVIGFFLAKIGL